MQTLRERALQQRPPACACNCNCAECRHHCYLRFPAVHPNFRSSRHFAFHLILASLQLTFITSISRRIILLISSNVAALLVTKPAFIVLYVLYSYCIIAIVLYVLYQLPNKLHMFIAQHFRRCTAHCTVISMLSSPHNKSPETILLIQRTRVVLLTLFQRSRFPCKCSGTFMQHIYIYSYVY